MIPAALVIVGRLMMLGGLFVFIHVLWPHVSPVNRLYAFLGIVVIGSLSLTAYVANHSDPSIITAVDAAPSMLTTPPTQPKEQLPASRPSVYSAASDLSKRTIALATELQSFANFKLARRPEHPHVNDANGSLRVVTFATFENQAMNEYGERFRARVVTVYNELLQYGLRNDQLDVLIDPDGKMNLDAIKSVGITLSKLGQELISRIPTTAPSVPQPKPLPSPPVTPGTEIDYNADFTAFTVKETVTPSLTYTIPTPNACISIGSSKEQIYVDCPTAH